MVELLDSFPGTASLSDYRLSLNKGYVIMLLRNLQPKKGHVNRKRHIVESMKENVLFLPVSTGNHHKEIRFTLSHIPCNPGDDNFPIEGFQCTHFPVRVYFALTINKAQVQSYSGAPGLDLRSKFLTHGHLYVALSRTTHPNNLYVCTECSDRLTTNILYSSVLST